MDANSVDSFVYHIVGGANGTLFHLTGNELRLAHPGQRGNNLEVVVRVTDHGGLSIDMPLRISESFEFSTVDMF